MTLTLRAHAKINLALEILGRRDDGFHELVSVTQTISLADTLTADEAAGLAVSMRPPLVANDENLVRRAAELLAARAGRSPHACLTIDKRIPLAAGLGGGSSDAAAALRLLDRLWGTALSRRRALAPLAAQLGSDVSLFLAGGSSLIRGRGEQVEHLPAARPLWLVLVSPDLSPPDKTRALYRALQPSEWGDGSRTLGLAETIRAGRSIAPEHLVNSFDGAADRVYLGFADLRARLRGLTGRPFHLTGAGPSLFALCEDARSAQAAAQAAAPVGWPVYVAQSISQQAAIRASDR
ncbi:MAG: 4-(cytidine 5'-diphospho)-2-C-methyl-D-erythritol kinase [Chloroflexi bacterium]|nr:4-(cytidine 5'-diphospho)-2-C-methyl-D-erythritol kinase [Chloroflexota bacterium]